MMAKKRRPRNLFEFTSSDYIVIGWSTQWNWLCDAKSIRIVLIVKAGTTHLRCNFTMFSINNWVCYEQIYDSKFTLVFP